MTPLRLGRRLGEPGILSPLVGNEAVESVERMELTLPGSLDGVGLDPDSRGPTSAGRVRRWPIARLREARAEAGPATALAPYLPSRRRC